MYASAYLSGTSQLRHLGALIAAASILAAVSLHSIEARANDIVVKYDQSQLLRLPRPAKEVVIGNPSIADVAIQGGDMLVITGKSFGITNIIALDGERNVIQDNRVVVQRDELKSVNVVKGNKRESYHCSPQCNVSVTIGDDPGYFEVTAKHAERKFKLSEGSAENSSSGQ